MKKPILLMTDIGYGETKVLTHIMNKNTGEKEFRTAKFPSVKCKDIQKRLSNPDEENEVYEDYIVEINELSNTEKTDTQYLLFGHMAVQNNGTRDFSGKEAKIDIDRLKEYVATSCGVILDDCTLNCTKYDICLGVGLPLSHHRVKEKKEAVINGLMGYEFKIKIKTNTGIKSIVAEIVEVYCYAQGVGAFAYINEEYKKHGEVIFGSNVGIIDVGYNTTDYAYFKANSEATKSLIQKDLSDSFADKGMSAVYKKTLELFQADSKNTGVEVPSIEKLESVLTRKNKKGLLTINFKQYDFNSYFEAACKIVADDITDTLDQRWGKNRTFLEYIFIVGGGGQTLFKYMKNKQGMWQHACLTDKIRENDSSYDNVRGYYYRVVSDLKRKQRNNQ